MKMLRLIAAAASLLAAIAAPASTTSASAFSAWEVANVSYGDVLNVRRWPSAQSQIRAAYPNGTVLSLTGKCKDAPNYLDQIAHYSPAYQAELVRFMWCEVWHDPTQSGAYEPGWIYMKYARPFEG